MKRSYIVMRKVLQAAFSGKCGSDELRSIQPYDELFYELKRLEHDGLIDSSIRFDTSGAWVSGELLGLTDEGESFYRLIENDKVWELIFTTLKRADIDVSYPLLKEVCEEIVERYVSSFIPDM